MKTRIKTTAVALLVPAAILISSPAIAANEGQIEGGNIYRIKNITQNIDFTDPQTANKCDVIQYKVRIHNPGPGALASVNVKASLNGAAATSNTSTVTVSSINADPASTSDTATVNFSSVHSLSYLTGSTQLLDANGVVISNLPDGITAAGVNIGNVGVSIDNKRFVQFSAKVDCPVTPPVVTPPAALPQTGGEAAGLAGVAGTGIVGYAAMAYRRSKRSLADALRNK